MTHDTAALWAEVHDALRRFIAKRVADQSEVEDILQDVFLRVHRHLERVNDSGRMVSWLYQIARHAIVDYYRSPKRRAEIPVGLAEDVDGRAPAAVTLSVRSAEPRAELAACLRPMLDRLAHEYRDAVTLVELEGVTHRAAAKRLGLSLSGMKSRVQRGRTQLKQMLETCCLINLDRRRGVMDYNVRDTGGEFCGGFKGECTPVLPLHKKDETSHST